MFRKRHSRYQRPSQTSSPVARRMSDVFVAFEEARQFEDQLFEWFEKKQEEKKKEKEKDEKKRFWEKKATFWQIFIFFTLMQPVQWIVLFWLFK